MINYRFFFTSAAIYSSMGFLPAAFKFFLFPIFVQFLSPSDYGILGLNNALVNFFTIVVAFGIDNSFTRFYYDYRRSDKLLESYLSSLTIFISAVSIAVFIVFLFAGNHIFGYFFKEPSYTFFPYGIYPIVLAFCSSIDAIILTYFRNKEKPLSFMTLTLVTYVTSTLFEAIAVLYYRTDANGVLVARTCGYFISSLIFWLWFFRKINFSFDMRFLIPSLKYAFPFIIYTVLGFIYMDYDRIMIENNLTLNDLGIYNVAFTIASLVGTFISAVDLAALPKIFELLKEGKEKNTDAINKILRITGLMELVFTGIVAALSPIFILYFTNEMYHSSLIVLPLLIVGFMSRYAYGLHSKFLFYYGTHKKLPYINLVAAVTLIGANFLLLPKYGLLGSGIAMLLSRFSQIPYAAFLVHKHINFRYELKYMPVAFYGSAALLLCFPVAAYFFNQTWHFLYFLPGVFIVLVLLFYFLQNNVLEHPGVQKIKQLL